MSVLLLQQALQSSYSYIGMSVLLLQQALLSFYSNIGMSLLLLHQSLRSSYRLIDMYVCVTVIDPLAVHHQLYGASLPADWLCCNYSGK